MQQYAPRAAPAFRSFGQVQESADASPEEYAEEATPTPRFGGSRLTSRSGSSYTPSPASTMGDAGKPGYNPFPEEVSQDYSSSTLFAGASETAFPPEISNIINAGISTEDIEVKPDGAIYLPESRYRRILCKAFGAGGWCLVPRGAHTINNGILSREYALYCAGRFISQVRGHAAIQGFSNPAMASEVVRSNALMRACKDLGIGNELWDPAFVAEFKATHAARRPDPSTGKPKWQKINAANSQSNY